MNKEIERDCCECKFFDGICCMYVFNVKAILDTEEAANKCENYIYGIYKEEI